MKDVILLEVQLEASLPFGKETPYYQNIEAATQKCS